MLESCADSHYIESYSSEKFLISIANVHVTVIKDGVRIGNWIYWIFTSRNN
jgi:hypothetical protein